MDHFLSVERYDTRTKKWSRISDMNARRSGAGVGVQLGNLYAIGGHDGPLVRRSAEKYNAEDDTWTEIAGKIQIKMFKIKEICSLDQHFINYIQI